MVKTPSLLDLIKLVPAAEITRAANALGVGPEALKKRIVSLESALGTSIVDTATKALKPGEAGRLVIDHASRIFSQARDLTRDLEELAGLQAPELNFGTDMFAAELPLGAALGRMASANSRLRVRAVNADFEHLARDVLAGKLEFAIADTTSAERHPTRLAIEPVAEHRLFFYVRQGHPLAATKMHSLETILVFPVVAPRLPPRIGGHVVQSLPHARIDRETGDLLPNLMLDSFAAARNLVLAGNAVGLAPLSALESDLRSRRLALIPFSAPWLNLNYGLFYPRKRALPRVAQLFMTQLREVESAIQAREQRALSRLEVRRRPRRNAARGAAGKKSAAHETTAADDAASAPAAHSPRKTRTRK
jgi:DNA-binding transcriptional LysR family regulator